MTRSTTLLACMVATGAMLLSASAQEKPQPATAEALDEISAREQLLNLRLQTLRDQIRQTSQFVNQGSYRELGAGERATLEKAERRVAVMERDFLQMSKELEGLKRRRDELEGGQGTPTPKVAPRPGDNVLAGNFIKVGGDYINLNYVTYIDGTGNGVLVHFVTGNEVRPYGAEQAKLLHRAMEAIAR